ncbi:hypothetical protein A0H76_521 [Hepatospora eriocheir]|uniref:Uncharacterized protein n=1 Tax=Hepatospora eriocheir TaxID=1081669 RepID=A0A1X0Q8P1_9MICR|nr:hypothetical protein A0H76_521 [Hepatospora eriocheir]
MELNRENTLENYQKEYCYKGKYSEIFKAGDRVWYSTPNQAKNSLSPKWDKKAVVFSTGYNYSNIQLEEGSIKTTSNRNL